MSSNRRSLTLKTWRAPQPYQPIWQAMQAFAHTRDKIKDADQLWLMSHHPVYTQGQAGKPEHLIHPDPNIPVIQSNRGGQITYHGPGQLMIYPLFHLPSLSLTVTDFVRTLEAWIIDLLAHYHIAGERHPGAPGVYHPNGSKLASIGLRVSRGTTYHGICLNVCGDLSPFDNIHPCGYPNQRMQNIIDDFPDANLTTVATQLLQDLPRHFPYDIPIKELTDVSI